MVHTHTHLYVYYVFIYSIYSANIQTLTINNNDNKWFEITNETIWFITIEYYNMHVWMEDLFMTIHLSCICLFHIPLNVQMFNPTTCKLFRFSLSCTKTINPKRQTRAHLQIVRLKIDWLTIERKKRAQMKIITSKCILQTHNTIILLAKTIINQDFVSDCFVFCELFTTTQKTVLA